MLQRVDHHLMDLNEGEMFVTVLYGVLDGRTQCFEMVSNHQAGIARFDDVTVVVIQKRRDGPPGSVQRLETSCPRDLAGKSQLTTRILLLIVAGGPIFGYLITLTKVTDNAATLVSSITEEPWLIRLLNQDDFIPWKQGSACNLHSIRTSEERTLQ